MSGYNLLNGATIIVEKTGESFHTYNDWKCYIANNDCIGDPVLYSNYVEIPGRDGQIDLSELLSNRPVFKSRPIKIWLAGIRDITVWDSVISALRNHVEGRVCRIIFDTDPTYFWKGRISIQNFKPKYEFGKFLLTAKEADPYKYDILSSAEPWLWDPFNFETGIITYQGGVSIVGSGSITISKGRMPTCPQIVVSEMQSGTFTVTYGGKTFALAAGTNVVPSIMVGGESDVTLEFTGTATVQVVYRGGSL